MFLIVGMLFLTMTSTRAMPNMRPLSEDVEYVTVSEIVSEQTRIKRSDSGDCQFPSTLLFQFDVQGEKATLDLEKNVYLSRRIPIYITQNGQSYQEELNDTKDEFATYQDVVRGSSMLVFCQEDGTFKLHGSFRHGGELYRMSHSGNPEPAPVHYIQRSQELKGSFRNDAIMPPDEVIDELLESTSMRRNVQQKMENSMEETVENIIELLFTVDKSVYQLFLDETGRHKAAMAALEQYAVLQANEIDLYFYSVTMLDPSLIIKIYLAGVEIPERGSDVSWSTESQLVLDGVTYVDYNKLPLKVEAWRQRHNIQVQYDHVMALTRYVLVEFKPDIAASDMFYALGVAYVGTMCRKDNAYTVSAVVVSSLKVAVTGAHELAHSLEVFHDGAASSKGCSSSDMNIMSILAMQPFNLTYAEAATKFSSCSVESMKCFIHRLSDGNCMKEHSFSKSDFEAQKELPFPGTVYSLDQQCQLYKGVSSSSCLERLSESNCHAGFQCSSIDALPDGCNVTDPYKLVPFTGTPCGEPEDDKWCYKGLCRPRQTSSTVQPPATTTSTTVSPFCSEKCCIRKSNGKKKCCYGLECCELDFGHKLDCCTLCNQVSSGSTTVTTTPTTSSEQCYEGKCCKRILNGDSKKKVCCTGKKCCKRSWGINTKCCKTCG